MKCLLDLNIHVTCLEKSHRTTPAPRSQRLQILNHRWNIQDTKYAISYFFFAIVCPIITDFLIQVDTSKRFFHSFPFRFLTNCQQKAQQIGFNVRVFKKRSENTLYFLGVIYRFSKRIMCCCVFYHNIVYSMTFMNVIILTTQEYYFFLKNVAL